MERPGESRAFVMVIHREESADLYVKIQEKNLLRQYDLLTNMIELALHQGPRAFDQYLLWSLNHAAVAGIAQFGGRFRQEPVFLRGHVPPPFWEVPELVDRFISFIHENWYKCTPTVLAAYGLWRLNWIHPFIEGNGRTARAVCYYLLSARSGTLLTGTKIVPERIRENRGPYVAALQQADAAWSAGGLNVGAMETYLSQLLEAQLKENGDDNISTQGN